MSNFTDVFGDGSDGAYSGGALVKGQTYNFTSFYLNSAITLGAGDGNKVHIKCQGDFEITSSGSITSNGTDALYEDTSGVLVNGVTYSVAPVNGSKGLGGARRTETPNKYGGKGGGGASISENGEDGTAAGGARGVYPGGIGQDGLPGVASQIAYGGGGGGGGRGATYSQNGVIIAAAGEIKLAGVITGDGAPGGDGGKGGTCGGAYSYNTSACQGCNGSGGAAGAGADGMKVQVVGLTAPTENNLMLVARGAEAGLPGDGGDGGRFFSPGNGLLPSSYHGYPGETSGDGTDGLLSIATLTAVSPGVTTDPVTNLSGGSVTLNGTIQDVYGENATERGFYWLQGSSGDPTSSDNIISSTGDFGAGGYAEQLVGLSDSTDYCVAAFATNSAGTTIGETVEITTPVFKAIISGTTGDMSSVINELEADTIYYVRAYATSSEGTAYGEEAEFKTQGIFAPQIITGN